MGWDGTVREKRINEGVKMVIFWIKCDGGGVAFGIVLEDSIGFGVVIVKQTLTIISFESRQRFIYFLR
jgi:hypothetical protein